MYEFLKVGLHAFRDATEMIATFQATDQPAFRMSIGNSEQGLRHVGEILRFQSERTDGIARRGRQSRRSGE